jgi:hypothetical protein
MRKLYVYVSLAAFLFSAVPAPAGAFDKTEPKAIRQTPPAPAFSDAERQAELARTIQRSFCSAPSRKSTRAT